MTPTRQTPKTSKPKISRRHASRAAFAVFVIMITVVSAITCWWLTMDGRLQVHLLPETQHFESYPLTQITLDRG